MALTKVLTGGIADDAVTGAKIENDPTIAGILTTNGLANINLVADTYRLPSNLTMSSGSNLITNWERDDASNDGVPIGSGLSQSSGVFTFAETGIYFIIAKNVFVVGGSGQIYLGVHIEGSFDSGSNYGTLSSAYTHIPGGGTSGHNACTAFTTLDVADTNVRLRIRYEANQGNGTLIGNTDINLSNFTVIRVGNT